MSAIQSTGTANPLLTSQISVAVAEKAQDAAKLEGEAALSLLQDAAQMQQQLSASPDPHRGTFLDVIG